MSKFVSNDETKKTDSKKLIFDYYNTKIYFHQYSQTPNNTGYVDIIFSTPANVVNPNIIYISHGPTLKYKSSKLFVYKKTHFIDDLVFDGEIVIENIPISNNNNNDKIYVCIPLKTNASIQSTDIDEMISTADVINSLKISMDINLNEKMNKKNPYFYYENGSNKIVVLNTAIEVNTSFEKFKTCDLFPNYDENYLILQNITDGFANVVEGFQEGATTFQTGTATIQTCTPIDENDKDVSNGLIVNYLNGNLTSQNKTIDLLFSLIIFIIISLISLFVSPHLYKNVFITTLNDNDLNQTALFCFFYLLLACSLLFGGIFYDYPSAVTGLILLIFFAMSFIFIYNKGNSDSTYLEGATWINKITSMKFSETIAAAWRNIFNIMENTHSILIPVGIMITLAIFLIFVLVIFKDKKSTKGKTKKTKGYTTYVYIMLSIFGFVYSGLVVGPFYYYYAVNLPPPPPPPSQVKP